MLDKQTKKDHDDKLSELNFKLKKLEEEERFLKKSYDKSIEEKKRELAFELQDQLRNIEKDIDDLKSDVSILATTSYGYLRKAEQTDTYIKKMTYTLLASPLDKLDKTICCLLKLIIKQIDVDFNIPTIDEELFKRLEVGKVIKAIESIKSIINIIFVQDQQKVNQLLNKTRNFLMSPVRKALSYVINILSEYKIKIVGNIEDLFQAVLTSDYDNPDNILDCIHFEAFADFVWNGIEDFDKELRDRITDYYKFIYKTTDFLSKDAIKVEEKEKIRQINNILNLLLEILESINDFKLKIKTDELSLTKGLEQWIESILIRHGFGTTYNSRTGQYERISLKGCLDVGQDTGSFRSYLSENYENMPEINIEEDSNYRNFISNHNIYNYDCKNRF